MAEPGSAQALWRKWARQLTEWPVTSRDDTTARRPWWSAYLSVTALVAGLTGMLWLSGLGKAPLVNVALLYLLPVLVAAVAWGQAASLYAAGLGVMAFDFFFVPPLLSYSVSDLRYLLTFAVFLLVAVLTARLASRLQVEARDARRREAWTLALYALSRQIADVRTEGAIAEEVARHAALTFAVPAAVALAAPGGSLVVSGEWPRRGAPPAPADVRGLAQVLRRGQGESFTLHVPLMAGNTTYGVLVVGTRQRPLGGADADRRRVLEAMAGLAAAAVARVRFAEAAEVAHLAAESERIRTALLDSISHELKTPLATIMGGVGALGSATGMLSPEAQRELWTTVQEAARRLDRLVTNLLGMVRLESGMLHLNRRWSDVSDMVGVALRQVSESIAHRPVTVAVAPDLPPLAVDEVLVEQVLVNLLSNAAKYSAPQTPLWVSAEREGDVVQLTVRDVGIGIAPEEAEQVFDKFYRSPRVRSIPGTGLGLAICRGIVAAHGGTIRAEPAEGGGTRMVVRLPIRELESDQGKFDQPGGGGTQDEAAGDDGEEARGPGGGCTGAGH